MRRLAAAVLLAAASDATAQTPPPCDATAAMIATLKSRYGEVPASAGVTHGGQRVVVFANRATGTFTIIIEGGRGVSCITTAGDGWQDAQPQGEGT